MQMNIRTWYAKALIGAAVGLLSLTANAQSVNSFTIVNADSDADVATFTNNATVSLATTPRINVRANTSRAASVLFTQGASTRTENATPFAFKGNSGSDYLAWAPTPGVYQITATPYASTGAKGTKGAAATLTLTVVAGGPPPPPPPSGKFTYEVIVGHDGHADPDDNLAALAGFIAVKRAQDQPGSRVTLLAMIYGDTTEDRQDGMIPGGPGTGDAGKDRTAAANYQFFKQFTRPSLQSMGFNTFFDVVTQDYDFNASSLTAMTTGGAFLAQRVKSAIGTKTRVVYSAGGGENTAAEAIAWLRKQGYSDTQIRDTFAIVQHSSSSNWAKFTESAARRIIADDFTIYIENQNPYSGTGEPPRTVKVSRTSATFANAWAVAVGDQPSGIANLASKRDASDAGSHHFASNMAGIETYWNRRGEPGVIAPISYKVYNSALMDDQLN
jgi:hypothetical protein